MSDTPRTDAAADFGDGTLGGMVTTEFARQLERELNQAILERNQLCEELVRQWMDNQ